MYTYDSDFKIIIIGGVDGKIYNKNKSLQRQIKLRKEYLKKLLNC